MGEVTGIEWTDHTFNPWMGCEKVSPACKNCYAVRTTARMGVIWGKDAERKVTSDSNWAKPILWDKKAEAAAYLRVGVRTLQTIRADHKIPHFIPLGLGPQSIRFRRVDLDAYIHRSYAASNPSQPHHLKEAS